MKQVVVKAYAKINLILDVLGKREDGYHEVEMVMQTISLHDEVILKSAPGIMITTNHPQVPTDKRNLAYQAAQLIQTRYPTIPGVEIIINKQIPIEAGLAGGSTDGAAVILGMNKLFSLDMTKDEMLTLAAQLGSDVPFCILGPTAVARGRGELLEEITPCPLLWLVLVKPEFGVKTPQVYKNLNLAEITDHPDLMKYIRALERKDKEYICNNLLNILEQSTFQLYPQVKEIKAQMYNLGAKNVLMSGSGPTVFALFSNRQEAEDFFRQVKGIYRQVYLAQTIDEEKIRERMKINE